MYDAKKVKTLAQLLYKQEIRGRDGSKKKLILLFFSYILPGIFLPLLLSGQNTDPTGLEYSFLTYLFFSVILAFTTITEFDNLILSKTEIDLFTSLPIDDELIVYAKLRVILRYLFVISIPLLLPGSIFYFFIIRSALRSLLYYISGMMLFVFLVNIFLMLYGMILKKVVSKRLGTYVLIFQVGLIFVLVIGYQFVTFTFTGYHRSGIGSYFGSLMERGYDQYFPQSWFAFIASRQKASLDYRVLLKLILPVVICYLSYQSLKYYLVANYWRIREQFLKSGAISPRTVASGRRFILAKYYNIWFKDHYLKNKKEDSSYSLVRSMFLRDRIVRLNIIPMIAVPIGLTIFALLTNQLPPPFGRHYNLLHPVFHLSIFLTVLMAVNTAVIGIRVINDSEASWVYNAYPLDNIKRFKNGVRKFFVINFLIPLSLILFMLYAAVMPIQQALVHTLFIFVCANLYNSLCHVFSRELPFTKENTVAHSIQRIASLILPILFGAACFVIQYYTYSGLIPGAIAVISILMVTFWLNYFGFTKFGKNGGLIVTEPV